MENEIRVDFSRPHVDVSALIEAASEILPWSEISARHPNEWLCLFDVQMTEDDMVKSARVVLHDRDVSNVVDSLGDGNPEFLLIHSWGKLLTPIRWDPRYAPRDIVRPRQ